MGSGSGGGGVDESHLGEDDDEEGEMINDIKEGGNGCESQKLIRRRKNKMEKKSCGSECEFKCECGSEGLSHDIPDTCKYCQFRMRMRMAVKKMYEEEAAEELVEEESHLGEKEMEEKGEEVVLEVDVGKLDENEEGGEEGKKCNCLEVAMRAYVNIKKMMDQSHHMTEEAAMHIVENYRKETEEYSNLKKTNKGLVDALFASGLINFGFAFMFAVKSSAILLLPVAWLWKNHMT